MSNHLLNAITQDHRVVYDLRDHYVSAQQKPHPRSHHDAELPAYKLMWEIVRHVSTEEALLHPLYVKYLGEDIGSKMARFDRLDHSEIKRELLRILHMPESLGPGTMEFENALEKVVGDLRRHNDSEEASDIPTLEKKMEPLDAHGVARAIEEAKNFFVPKRFKRGAEGKVNRDLLIDMLSIPEEQLNKEIRQFLGIEAYVL
ncbi:hypothetical protein JOM56_004479 [Amanita muscaria]